MRNGFFKGHGLGNDYIALDPADLEVTLTPRRIRAICDRHRGLGSDGILALASSRRADFGVRIYNPAGNGLRILGRYLHATRRTRRRRFTVETKGGVVAIELHVDGSGYASAATVEMGCATFRPSALPCRLQVKELIEQPVRAAGRDLRFTGVSVGNPHCVLFRDRGQGWTREELLTLGPALESHEIFPRRTNVQLATPIGPRSLHILIWERGAGETLASGSSSCAAAAAAVRLGRVQAPVAVKAEGGTLHIDVDEGYALTMRGAVDEVASGRFSPAFVEGLR